MRRRDYLKTTALGALSAVFNPNLTFGNFARPSNRIGVALIGAGNMGGKTHLPTIVGEDRIELRAICDVDSEVVNDRLAIAREGYANKTGQATFKGIDGLGDYRPLLSRNDIDAVVIAVPDHWHIPMAKEFVKAGKAVYIEKPLSLFIEEGRELVHLVNRHHAIVQVGTQRRSEDRSIIAAELVRNGALGKIRHVDVKTGTRSGEAKPWSPQPVPSNLDYEMWVGPGPMTPYHKDRVHYNFRFVKEYSGGDVTNMGAHYVDVAHWGLGVDESGPIAVSGTGQRNPEGSIHDVFHDVDVDFEYADDTTLKFKSTGTHWKKDEVVFHGEHGTLHAARELQANPPDILRAKRENFPVRFRKTKGGHMSNWVQCILDNKPENLHAPVEVGHRSATVCHLVNIAIQTGRKLIWDPKLETFIGDEAANQLLTRDLRKPWAS